VRGLLADGRVPVVSSIARGDDGEVYNVNADTAAAALAVALDAAKLIVLTDVEGLYADWPASDEVIGRLTADSPGCCPDCRRAWSRRWRPACTRCAAAFRRPTCSTGGSRTRCSSKSSPTKGSERWWCRQHTGARRR